MSRARRRRGERGMILLVVLWTVAIMSVVAVALSAYLQRSLQVAATDMEQLRTELALRSGFNGAAALLWSMKPEERASLRGAQRVIDLGGGITASVVISEATGRADLNAAKPELLGNLFTVATGSEAVARTLLAGVQRLRGDEAGEDGSRGAPSAGEASADGRATDNPNNPTEKASDQGPAQRGPAFQTPLQLQILPGARPEDINRLLPLVGVVSQGGRVNVLSAPEEVLRAIPGLGRNDLAVIAKARSAGDARNKALAELIARFPELLTAEASRAFIVTVRLEGGAGIIAGSSAFATILLTPDGAKPFQLLALSW